MPRADVSRVVKDRTLGIELPYKLGHILHELVDSLQRKLPAGTRVGEIEAGRLHLGAAVAADAGQRPHDVEEEAVGRKAFQDFPDMRLEKGFDVRGVQAQIAVKAGLKRRRTQEGLMRPVSSRASHSGCRLAV